jgi:hypothetical protein
MLFNLHRAQAINIFTGKKPNKAKGENKFSADNLTAISAYSALSILKPIYSENKK